MKLLHLARIDNFLQSPTGTKDAVQPKISFNLSARTIYFSETETTTLVAEDVLLKPNQPVQLSHSVNDDLINSARTLGIGDDALSI